MADHLSWQGVMEDLREDLKERKLDGN